MVVTGYKWARKCRLKTRVSCLSRSWLLEKEEIWWNGFYLGPVTPLFIALQGVCSKWKSRGVGEESLEFTCGWPSSMRAGSWQRRISWSSWFHPEIQPSSPRPWHLDVLKMGFGAWGLYEVRPNLTWNHAKHFCFCIWFCWCLFVGFVCLFVGGSSLTVLELTL